MSPWLTVVGIGEDGFKGLGRNARHALLGASRIVGGQRQLELLPACIRGERQPWPSPFSLEPVLAQRGTAVCVLASGDPMFFGVGASLARQLPAEELLILPAPPPAPWPPRAWAGPCRKWSACRWWRGHWPHSTRSWPTACACWC